MGAGSPFPGGKADHSIPTTAEVKYTWILEVMGMCIYHEATISRMPAQLLIKSYNFVSDSPMIQFRI
jgi:hypothetical protein